MRRLLLAICLTLASWSASAQTNVVGGGLLGDVKVATASYQGPGDVASSAVAWGSCARAYNAAYANGTNSLCDLVAVTGGAAVCTLRVLTTGFVDLAASYCAGTTPSAACAAASGGSCKVTKVYDQTGNGNHWNQATLGSMPALTFSALNGLPGLTCTNAAGTSMATGNVTLNGGSQPFSMSAVYKRTGTTGSVTAALASQASGAIVGGPASANNSTVNGGTDLTRPATDNSFHAIQGVFSNTVGTNNTDGSRTTGTTGAGTVSATPLRFCRTGAAISSDMVVMEGGAWSIGFSSTQDGNLNTNQHGTNGYNF